MMPFDLIPRNFMNLGRLGGFSQDLMQDFGRNFELMEVMVNELAKRSERSRIELSEDKKNVYVKAAVPGLSPDDIDISIEQGILQIKGEKKEEKKEVGEDRKFWQRAQQSFWYQIALPSSVSDTPEVNMENGMLNLTFAKNKQSQKKIHIKGSSKGKQTKK